jgi:hypothetical protein
MTDPMQPPPPAAPDLTLARAKTRPPAIALLILGIWGLGFSMLSLLNDLFARDATDIRDFRIDEVPEPVRGMIERIIELSNRYGQHGQIVNVFLSFVQIAALALVIFAAIRMLQLRTWTLAVVASILAMFPCCISCICSCGLAIPIGIWALIVLFDAQVKAAFRP